MTKPEDDGKVIVTITLVSIASATRFRKIETFNEVINSHIFFDSSPKYIILEIKTNPLNALRLKLVYDNT